MVRRKSEELSIGAVKTKKEAVKKEKGYKKNPALVKKIKSVAADLFALKSSLDPILKNAANTNTAMKGIFAVTGSAC